MIHNHHHASSWHGKRTANRHHHARTARVATGRRSAVQVVQADAAQTNPAQAKTPPTNTTPANGPQLAASSGTSVGIASFYGGRHAGRHAADGSIFNPNALTAAHRSLPFGTKVEVTNLNNGRSVVVRITDRGPFVHGRIIDVSAGAARSLDFVGRGVTKVKLVRLAMQ